MLAMRGRIGDSMNDIWRLSATELARLVRSREIRAREAAQAALDRLDAVNPQINAVVAHRPDLVLDQADAVDRKVARGEDPGVLAGVPVTVKINTDQAGFATTNGTWLQKDLVAHTNSPAVDNLVKAGAVLLGRSNAPAWALRWFTSNLLHGATRNPRNPTLTPGGSTGGGAAAVTAGIGHLAQGTDLGGSLRYPAYACGIHGLRPTLGRVPAYNASSPERPIGPQLLSCAGLVGRTVEDLRVGLAAMAAPDPRDPWWVPAPLEGPAMPLRAVMCPRPSGMQVAQEVAAAVLDAGRRLVDAGWKVEEIEDTPSMEEADAKAESYPADVISRALVRRATIARQWRLFLADHPVLLLPVSTELPFPDGLDLEGEAGFRRVWSAQRPLRAISASGLPGLAVSTGLVGSVPIGVQIVAAHYREDLCLLAGSAIAARGTPVAPLDPVG
jgi:amidase